MNMKILADFQICISVPLRYSKFCPDFSGHVGKRLDKEAKVNSEFMTSQTGKQIITIHILPNISRSKGNQTMKFRQLT